MSRSIGVRIARVTIGIGVVIALVFPASVANAYPAFTTYAYYPYNFSGASSTIQWSAETKSVSNVAEIGVSLMGEIYPGTSLWSPCCPHAYKGCTTCSNSVNDVTLTVYKTCSSLYLNAGWHLLRTRADGWIWYLGHEYTNSYVSYSAWTWIKCP